MQPTNMIGKKIIELDRVDSTNAYANRLPGQIDQEEGTVYWAYEQFAGKGQQGNKWESEAGKNLTFTVLIKPKFLRADQQFQLNKVIALGVLDFVESTLSRPAISQNELNSSSHLPCISIKWPNDIYCVAKKIGGILIEHKIMGQSIDTTLAGIGLNVNQTRFAPDIPNPVSMIHILGYELLLKDVLDSVCQYLDQRYQTLKEFGSGSLDESFNQHLLGFERWRNYSREGNLFEGKVCGVDNLGRLIIEQRDGKCHHFSHKEVEYVLLNT
jgi:BirA family biotin operon repressor/biotin-[acetyl-CoA-carboxylase] ligase